MTRRERLYADVLTAALTGGEDDLEQALGHLDLRELSGLLNTLERVRALARRRADRMIQYEAKGRVPSRRRAAR